MNLFKFIKLDSRRACLETTAFKLNMIHPPQHKASFIYWDGPTAKHGYVKETQHNLKNCANMMQLILVQFYLNLSTSPSVF